MTELIVYSSEKNQQCEELKDILNEQGIQYREIDIRNPGVITELQNSGCHALEPPVLKVRQTSVKTVFFTNDDLFWDGKLIREAVIDLAVPVQSRAV